MNEKDLSLLRPLSRKYDVHFFPNEGRSRAVIASDEYMVLIEIGGPILLAGFDGMNPKRTREQPVYWGRDFAAGRGFSGVHVYPLQNCWYRRDSLREIFRRIRETGFLDLFSRRVAAGGSMGGCGAIWHASALNCTDVLAFNPQAVLDPEMIRSGETRYREGWREVWRRDELKNVLEGVEALTVVYDPRVALDVAHVKLLRDCKPSINEICIPYAGHSTPIFLAKTGTLSALMEGFVRGNNTSNLARVVSRSRKRVGRYYANMAVCARNSGRLKLADSLSTRAAGPEMIAPTRASDDYTPL